MRSAAANQLVELLALDREPVAVTFCDSPPPGVEHIDQVAPSGCTYWKIAADGGEYYTEAADHYGCPVGSYTHGVDLPEEKRRELEGLIGTMVELRYIAMEEVPQIPRRKEPFRVAVYAPLRKASLDPDVVLVVGNARQIMLLAEAALAAGLASDSSMVGRPTCAAIPAVIQSGRTATNLGCIGNRVYTGLADDELYFVIAGRQLESIVAKLATLVQANRELEKFHRGRAVAAGAIAS